MINTDPCNCMCHKADETNWFKSHHFRSNYESESFKESVYKEFKNINFSQKDMEIGFAQLREEIRDLGEAVCELQEPKTGKVPHKCPVCEGTGGVRHPITGLIMPMKCHACEGKGILWR
jgi:DnaJ-class molecular chaperone